MSVAVMLLNTQHFSLVPSVLPLSPSLSLSLTQTLPLCVTPLSLSFPSISLTLSFSLSLSLTHTLSLSLSLLPPPLVPVGAWFAFQVRPPATDFQQHLNFLSWSAVGVK